MCGITGFINHFNLTSTAENPNLIIDRMMNAIHHRGPDDSGSWVDERYGVALGFRRLAILDLSPSGHQPMFSANDRYVIIFNGEIYNYLELRDELSALGHAFKGTSDTEVILAGILQWGVDDAVRHLNGMFAIALWDRQENTLHLVRDRMGIKPLYYGWCDGSLLFGSELKSLHAHPSFRAEIDRNSLSSYLRYSYIPAPHSIYQGVKKLQPGNILSINISEGKPREQIHPYWSAYQAVHQGISDPFQGNANDAIDALDILLQESVKQRMVADVPLGAFLSGGIDSSLIVALMQSQSTRPVKTFSIGFNEQKYNEAHHAKEVASHLNTDHTELYVSSTDAMNVIPLLPSLYDEPFGDSSQIPTYLVSRLAREHVTVSLSGDGGDELFTGYSRYLRSRKLWASIGWMPYPFRQMAANVSAAMAGLRTSNNLSTKLFFLSETLNAEDSQRLYLRLMSQWEHPDQLVINGYEPLTLLNTREQLPDPLNDVQRMMYLDLMTYLPDDVLVKLDRASMGVSLEARAPYLDDHRVIEFAWRLPIDMKIRQGQGKWILRQVLNSYIPRQLIDRPKMGFGVPIDTWLRGPLREWAEELLDGNRMNQEGYLNPSLIQKRWQEHKDNQKNWQYPLWNVLMFQAWLENIKVPAGVNG